MPETAQPVVGPTTPARPATAPATPARTRDPRTAPVAVGAGLAVAGLVLVLRVTGVLDGHPALLVAFLLVLAVPSSRLGVRRLLLVAGCAAGLLPALWWWDLPLGDVGRVGVLLAALAGGLTAWVLRDGRRGLRPRALALLPTWRPVDLVVAATAASSALALRGTLAVRTGAEALAARMPAWDSSAHVDMVLAVRRTGTVVPSLAAPGVGETWKFADYPQGYHAVVATVMELLGTAHPAPLADELVLLVRAEGFVLATVAVVLVAGLCALPTAPRRVGAVAVAAAGVAGVFLVGIGHDAFGEGFPNFVLGCAMAGAAVLLAASLPRVLTPAPLIALGGLLVGVAHCWVPLLALALPAVAVAAVPARPATAQGWRAVWRPARRGPVVAAVVVVGVAAGLGVALMTLRRLSATEVLVIPGGIQHPPLPVLLAVALAAVALPLAARGPAAGRSARLAAVPACGLLAAGAVAALQLRGGGELSYYFWKLLLGVVLVSVVVLAAALVLRPTVPAPAPAPGRVTRLRTAAAVAIGCLALLEVNGVGRSTGALEPAPDQLTRATDLLRAAEVAQASGRTDLVYVRGDGTLHAVNGQQWLLSLTGTWTSATEARAIGMVHADGAADAAALALAGGGTLLVAPADVEVLGLATAPPDRVLLVPAG